MKKTGLILDIVLLVLSAALCFGTKFVFHACAPKEDGGWMVCHWAEQAVFGLGLVLFVLSIAVFIFKDGKTKSGIILGMEAVAALAAVLPNHLINLCMMTDMRCHSVMKPAVLIIGLVIVIVGAISAVVHRKEDEA